MGPAEAGTMKPKDIRDRIFFNVREKSYLARISCEGEGILSGTPWLRDACKDLGIRLIECKEAGERVRPTDLIALIEGRPKQMALAEEELIGWVSKSSGIATAAWRARKIAGRHLEVVSGAWKKMPPPMKDLVRQAIADGGIRYRISGKPFIYLDKNYVKILGGVKPALDGVKKFGQFVKVIQLKSKNRTLCEESILAAQFGADIIMIDTGNREDIGKVDEGLRERGLRETVRIAFGGNISVEDLSVLKKMPVDIVDLGKAIVDAPLLDMKIDIMDRF